MNLSIKSKKKIEKLGPWYQTIDFNGILTNTNHPTGTAEEVYQDIRSFLPKYLNVMNFLDIGCSASYFIIRLMMDGAGQATGVDINPKCIEQSKFVKNFFLGEKAHLKLFSTDWKEYLKQDKVKTGWFDVIIASSVLYPRFLKSPKITDEWIDNDYHEKAKLLTDKTFTIITRWRQEDNCRNGDLFYEQLKKFNYHETKRKSFATRTLVKYQKGGNLKLAKNDDKAFNQDRPRQFEEIITRITNCKNMRVWYRLDKKTDISPWVSYIDPKILKHRDFEKLKIYNTKTQLEFIEKHKPKLLKSVKEKGIVAPIVVREKDGIFWVDDGNHRAGIAQSLGFKKTAIIHLKEI